LPALSLILPISTYPAFARRDPLTKLKLYSTLLLATSM